MRHSIGFNDEVSDSISEITFFVSQITITFRNHFPKSLSEITFRNHFPKSERSQITQSNATAKKFLKKKRAHHQGK